jgi:excisionase family DNA binding protein
VSARRKPLSVEEIRRAFESGRASAPPIVSPGALAAHLGLSVKTVYEWLSRGRLDGAYRKRGKHVLIWRDRAIDTLFNGTDWQ